MEDDFVTRTELAMLLVLCGGPVYAVFAVFQLLSLRRSRIPWPRVAVSVVGAVLATLPLTLAAWVASGVLRPVALWEFWGSASDRLAGVVSPDVLSYIKVSGFVVPPAVIASAITFPTATWLARRAGRQNAA
jgi:hypothetical protein